MSKMINKAKAKRFCFLSHPGSASRLFLSREGSTTHSTEQMPPMYEKVKAGFPVLDGGGSVFLPDWELPVSVYFSWQEPSGGRGNTRHLESLKPGRFVVFLYYSLGPSWKPAFLSQTKTNGSSQAIYTNSKAFVCNYVPRGTTKRPKHLK